MLRLLSQQNNRRRASSSASSTAGRRDISLNIRVSSYGSVFMPFPQNIPGEPRTDKEFSGDLEVDVPHGMGSRRVKAIRVGLRTTCTLDMGPGRKGEEDVVWEGTAEIIAGNSEGVVLEEGIQRFAFTLIIPGNLAPHDYHPGHKVDNKVFAEVQGLDEALPWWRSSSGASPSSSRGTSPSSYRSRSGSPQRFGSTPPSLSILRQEVALPQPPSYELEQQAEWLYGTYRTDRLIKLIYNPDPAGGVNVLDVRVDRDAAGLGPFTAQFSADEWSIGSRLRAQLSLPAPSPKATVYFVRAGLLQTVDVTSPRDNSTVQSQKQFSILTLGELPKLQGSTILNPDADAIWRGTEVGGTNQEQLSVEGTARMPNDYEGRPSTLEGVETPIHVSHKLVLEVFFSVGGEDMYGRPLEGKVGDLRVLKVEKPVIVPACFLIPEVLDLPSYRLSEDSCPAWTQGKTDECPLCHTSPTEQFCRTCPTSVPHPRHDHDPKLVGNANGVCPLCAQRIIPAGQGEWRDCACGLRREDMIERMKKLSLGEEEDRRGNEEDEQERVLREKEEAERGRRAVRS